MNVTVIIAYLRIFRKCDRERSTLHRQNPPESCSVTDGWDIFVLLKVLGCCAKSRLDTLTRIYLLQ